MQQPTDHFIEVNDIKLHYVDHGGNGPILIMMHGLTANGHAFDGIAAAGLAKSFRLICPDLRGRGQSDHPAFHYTFEDHAKDIVGLVKHLGVDKVHLAGHSFGGYLAFYIAVSYPSIADKIVILDAAKAMNPNAANMLGAAVGRLSATYPSFDDYLKEVKAAPYLTFWDDHMLSYYQADVKTNEDGTVRPRSSITDIIEISYNVANIDWPYYIERVEQTTIIINALDVYTLGEPLLPDNIALDTVGMMQDAKYIAVDGNHQTMLYGDGAIQITKAIKNFLL